MLRVYGPDLAGETVDAESGRFPAGAAWADLDQPTAAEERLVEAALKVDVPTRDDMAEIEPSSRLYEHEGALYMTLSVLFGVEEGHPTSAPIGFVLTDDCLVTVRYVSPKPVRAFVAHLLREASVAADPLAILYGLLDAIVDRLADELEHVGGEIERISGHVFRRDTDVRRIPADRLTALLTRIGRTQSLLARVRETALSASRLLSFLSGAAVLKQPEHRKVLDQLGSIAADTTALIDHSAFLSNNLSFILDATLGLISIEQNAAMKLFSWAALIFLPPTLVAGVYGMNFRHMPELSWLYGYPMALALMVASAVLPLWYLRRRGWI